MQVRFVDLTFLRPSAGPSKKKDQEKKIMSEDQVFSGLCISCQNAPECTFPRDPSRPVGQCDEFRGENLPPEGISLEGRSLMRTGLIQAEKDPSPWIGLCKNCENREFCRFPKPEGGVWRCEEYL